MCIMAEIKIVQRSLKLGEYYKFPLKSLKLLEFNKINIHSLYVYLLVQDYLVDHDSTIIFLKDFELAYNLYPLRLMDSLEMLRIHKLIIYKKISENSVAINFLGFNTDAYVEVEIEDQVLSAKRLIGSSEMLK